MSKNASETQTQPCPDCGGRGFRYVEGQAGVQKCGCKVETHPGRVARLLARAEIPRKYADCRLTNYSPSEDSPHLVIALSDALGYVEHYLKHPSPNGLLFQGSPGLGKTHLAIGIIRDLIEMGSASCFFCDFAAELQKIRDSMSTDRSSLILPRLVYDADVLVLDDFGAQRWSGWVQDQMSNVISNRYNAGRATIITTNLTDTPSADHNAQRIAVMKKLGVMNHQGEIDTFQKTRLEQCGIRFNAQRDEPETLEDQIGERLRSRLYEMCQKVPMYGQDYRKVTHARPRDISR
jgi:DNA replication protein DnaC